MPRHEKIRKFSRAEIRRIMRKLNGRQRQRVLNLAGRSLDFSRVPDSVWMEFTREIKDEFLSVLGIIYLLSWDSMRRLMPFDWYAWPVEQARRDGSQKYAEDRSKFLSEKYVENVRNVLVPSTSEDAPQSLNRVFGEKHGEVVAVTETASVIPAAEADYSKEVERKNPNTTMIAVWKHHDHRPPGHSRAEIDPCAICSPLEGLRSTDWPEKYKAGPPSHPNCDCHLEWEVVFNKQDR